MRNIQLVSKTPIKKTILKQKGNWDCKPVFEIGHNAEGKIIQNVTLTLIRKKDFKEVTIVTITSFELELGDKEMKPTTTAEFEFYVLISQMAHAHTRMIFLYEMEGTPFEGQLLPQDSNEGMLRKIQWAFNLKGRES